MRTDFEIKIRKRRFLEVVALSISKNNCRRYCIFPNQACWTTIPSSTQFESEKFDEVSIKYPRTIQKWVFFCILQLWFLCFNLATSLISTQGIYNILAHVLTTRALITKIQKADSTKTWVNLDHQIPEN